jgi:hypothetical protein
VSASSRLRRGALVAAVPVVAATCFYLLFRGPQTWLVGAALGSPLGPALRVLRATTVPVGSRLPALPMAVAPDLLWALGLGALLSALHAPGSGRRWWFAIGLSGAVGYEVAQRLRWVPGTFDVQDLVAQALGFVVGWRVPRQTSF